MRPAPLAAGLCLLGVAALPANAARQQLPAELVALLQQEHSPEAGLLDVPFVLQSEALCGGAAVAMVMRYWGERDVRAEDFSSLVDEKAGGIRASRLAQAVRSRGWQALPFRGESFEVRQHLKKGRPVVALIEYRPERYHYVVLVGWADEHAVFHDPAAGPFRVSGESDFQASWTETDRWALLILPPASGESSDEGRASASASSAILQVPCTSIVQAGVRLARSGDLSGAEAKLSAAVALCPGSSAPPRELAGLRFLQERWEEAAVLAERAVALAPGDRHGWRVLATSQYLAKEPEQALLAWNRLEEPRVDLVRINGLERTRHAAVDRLLSLSPGTVLTPKALRRARMRVASLPAGQGSKVTYRPLPEGLAQVEVAVIERPLLGNSVSQLVVSAVRAFLDRELSANLASPSGGGELWTLAWRWWPGRPRLSGALAIPSPGGFADIWQIEGFWEEQSYGVRAASPPNATAEDGVVRETRSRFAFTASQWITGDLRWKLVTGLDHWQARGEHLSAGGGIEARLAADHLALGGEGAGWFSLDGEPPFWTAAASSSWRSGRESRGLVLAGRAAFLLASEEAPLALWPGAGVGHARTPLLRAHPLLEDGVVRGKAFGRRLAHGTLEVQAWPWALGPARVGWAGFLDSAKVWGTRSDSRVPVQVDVGTGLRLGWIGGVGMFRVDLAWGLRDGDLAVSAAWQPSWPGGS